MKEIVEKSLCCGCTACVNICPKKCISMEADREGFKYPVIDEEKCINCGLCKKNCPMLKESLNYNKPLKSYIVQYENENVLNKTTSGGFAFALAECVIKSGGYVAGAVYGKEYEVQHILTSDIERLNDLAGSKYSQSDLGDIFIKVKEKLEEGKDLLFVGTPCQVAGLKSYLNKEYEKLILVDFVCRSIPSPLLWKKYLDYQRLKYKSEIVKVNCRNKTYGYHSGSLILEFENRKKYSGSNRVDIYMNAFHKNICSRKSCYNCKFKNTDRVSDFTVFDCWAPTKMTNGVIKDNNKGYSNVVARTEKAILVLEKIASIYRKEVDNDIIFGYTGGMEKESIIYKKERDEFYSVLEAEGIIGIERRFLNITIKDRFIEKMKPVIYRRKMK